MDDVQGPSWQAGFFELALTDRNIQVRFCLKVVLEFWDLRKFADTFSFYEMHSGNHLQLNLQISLLSSFLVNFLLLLVCKGHFQAITSNKL